jgi:hypothetical protein
MNFNLKTKVFKSLVICLTLLLIYSCETSEQNQFKQQKKEKLLTNNKEKSKEQSVENVSSKEVVSIESKIEKDKVVKPKLLSKKKDKIEYFEISDSSKSYNQIKTESIPFKYSGHPFAGSGASSNKKNGVGEPAKENEIKRFYISTPNLSKIKNDEFCKISFKISADANGNVISARVTSSGTTTTNQELINQVREIVKSELKYNKVDPNTPVFSDLISIAIHPN